jgi:hypothetical protein
MPIFHRVAAHALAIAAVIFPGAAVQAVPILQLYVEGSTYDTEHESWVFDAVLGEAFTLWVIGNVDGPGGFGTIFDVKVAVAYPDLVPGDGQTFNVSFTPTTTDGLGGFTDPSVPAAPSGPTQISEDGDAPLMSDGSPLPSHGVYGPGTEWQEFLLGNFDLTDSPIADFIGDFPDSAFANAGQINAYEVLVTSVDPDLDFESIDIHFDAYDGVEAGNRIRAVFAPFSHDAETGINHPAPEPGTLLLMAAGLTGIWMVSRRRAVARR